MNNNREGLEIGTPTSQKAFAFRGHTGLLPDPLIVDGLP